MGCGQAQEPAVARRRDRRTVPSRGECFSGKNVAADCLHPRLTTQLVIVTSALDILRAASARRLMRLLAAGLLALALLAPADAVRAGQGGASGISTTAALDAPFREGPAVSLGQANGPGFGQDDSIEDPFKLGRALKAVSPKRLVDARRLSADPHPEGLGAALPERPPRA